ncbi:MAG: CheR family methyltransferase [Candidatus Binatia bacterium]
MAEENENPEGVDKPAPQDEKTADVPDTEALNARVPIVGIGASAGGLEALEAFFDAMPTDSGIAFVIVTHQAADRVSLLPELLRNHTTMPVYEVTDGVRAEPNTIYLPPAGMLAALLDGVLQPMPGNVTHGVLQFPVDYFFRSLADDRKDKAICIVLSGTGTDGTLGVQAVNGVGGLVIVQEEHSAKFAGMPTSAAATGAAAYVLAVEQMPRQLLSFVQGPYLQAPAVPTASVGVTPEVMRQVCVLLRSRTRQDFSVYKTRPLERRIERRMNVHQIRTAEKYLRFLYEHPYELDLLFQELLIGVTNFFRDPQAFAFLADHALPDLLAAHPDTQPLRVWVPGCSTGEEAYSLAMLLREGLERAQKPRPLQIFATDVNPQTIEKARSGLYPGGIAVDVSAERLERFFVTEDGNYRIKKEIRDVVVFAEQNVITDPPFTKLDLLSCRNLLIYLTTEMQHQLVPLFHYALNPGGLLFLGSSETIGGFTDLFATLDHRWKVFKRKDSPPTAPLMVDFPTRARTVERTALPLSDVSRAADATLATLADRVLVQQFVPPSVIVNERGDIVYIHGLTGHFLQPAPGPPTHNIHTMAREGLRMDLLAAIREATTQDQAVVHKGVEVRTNGEIVAVDVRVQKITEPEALHGLVLVSFVEPPPPSRRRRKTKGSQGEVTEEGRVTALERETQMLRDTLQSTIEEANSTNEELNSTNEELQSTNEELQSANEELETAKEEMQSLNEELQTVNSELQSKVEQLSRTNDDMQNLLNSTDIATLFLDNQLCIKRFTPQTKHVFKLIAADVGRPISDIVSSLHYEQLETDAREVLRTLTFKELEVAAHEDQWYSIRLLPYRTSENVIDGLVMTFVDISRQKQAEQTHRTNARHYVDSVVDILREAFVVLDDDLRVVSVNRAFARMFQLSQHDVVGQRLLELQGGGRNTPPVRGLLEETLTQRATRENVDVELALPNLGKKKLMLNARGIAQTDDLPVLILLAMEKIE